jgi:uncharacterized NAD(P)/FAD-binding protein YdhS
MSIDGEGSAVGVNIKERRSSSVTREQFSRVINCTGFGPLGSESYRGLLGQLIRDKMLSLDPHGLGVSMESGGPVARAKGLFVIGALLRSERWESTAVPELRAQAKEIADSLAGNPT